MSSGCEGGAHMYTYTYCCSPCFHVMLELILLHYPKDYYRALFETIFPPFFIRFMSYNYNVIIYFDVDRFVANLSKMELYGLSKPQLKQVVDKLV